MTANKSKKLKLNTKSQKSSVSRRRILLIILAVVLTTAVILVSAELIRSNCTLDVSFYEFETDKVTSSIRIVLISDIHGKRFSDDNSLLYDTVSAQAPDIIMLAGDIIDRTQQDDSDLEFLRDTTLAFTDIAPVYYSLGNHERQNSRLDEIKSTVINTTAVFLDNDYIDVSINGDSVRIGGISTFMQWDDELLTFLPEFGDTDSLKLLMCHNPEYFIWGVKDYDFDLMLCGHTHAGMVRLPFIGALYVPEQGKLPKYDRGLFTEDSKSFVITGGIGNSPLFLPRFLNPSEITVVDIVSRGDSNEH